MGTYYTATCILLWLALGVLCILVREDERLGAIDKRLHYAAYAIIGASLLAEWAGVILSGIPAVPDWAIRLVKCFDYILTPMAGGALTAQMRVRNHWGEVLVGVLAANAALQVVSFFTGWMVTVEGVVGYSHGPLYWAYMLVYVAVILLVVVQFLAYGKSFKRENRLSLWATSGMAVVGILLQEAFGAGVRTAYVGLTLGAALLYIHSAEFAQQRYAERMRSQQRQITTDALTGTRSRHAYARALDGLASQDELPRGFAVFSIDVNGLKETNDLHGHEAGDDMLCGTAECIMEAFAGHGSCYRVGGDEFVVIARMTRAQAEEAVGKLGDLASAWGGNDVAGISLSIGYAIAEEHPECSCEELLDVADKQMYAMKAAYYAQEGHDRRWYHIPTSDAAGGEGDAPAEDAELET